MSSTPPLPQTASSKESAASRPHRPAACEFDTLGATPAQSKVQLLSGTEPTATLAVFRENDSTSSSFTINQRQKRRKSGWCSLCASSDRKRRFREGPSSARDARRHSALPRDVIWTIDTQPDWLPGAHVSDNAATETPGNSVAMGVEPQPPMDSGFLVNLNAAAATTTKPSIDESHQPSDAPAHKTASITKHTTTPSSTSDTAVGYACLRTVTMGHSSSMSERSRPCKSSMTQRRSLDSWSARNMEDQAPGDRGLCSTRISPADNDSTASSAVKTAHETAKGLQRWSSFRHPPATSDDLTVPPPSRDQHSELNKILRTSSFVALFTLATTILAILLLPQSHFNTGDKTLFCSSSDCAYHVHVLGLNRSRTAKPCDDFGRFVCSGWVNKYRDVSFTVQIDAVMDWITRLSQSSRRANWTAGVTERPLNMMRLCLEGATSKADAVREYVSFVNGRSFAWPTSDWNETAVVQPRLPLRALLDLAVKWGLPLWFRVNLVSSHREDRMGVVISPSPFPAAFHYLHSRFLR
ncbi:hypothetical protein HPB51_027862 [Rhipicephalus microplus]|uniref:Peptidase M13 N-terminal domain-containing protein n=1 Tax=Rhipicephalus microplus TaxID=6941 RepID=A0A9J6CZ42_RHIMP|nr:hypothetical protein HPB51_027862 [Rhipicephalus microplus]